MPEASDEEPYSLIDVARHNPWWEGADEIPVKTLPRADLYWRVRNTLENDIVLIPGAAATGTTNTLRQIVRALVRGVNHESERIQTLFREDRPSHVDERGCSPAQVCFVPCSDPLAHLVDDFLERVRQTYHPRGARTGERTFYLLLPDIHRLDDWQTQLTEMYRRLEREFPGERWTVVTSVPIARLAYRADIQIECAIEVDRPHHTQKYRDTLLARVPELAERLRPVRTDSTRTDCIEQARTALCDAAAGNCAADKLQEAFGEVENRLRTVLSERDETLAAISRSYLVEGGFAPALTATGERETTYPVDPGTVQAHVERGLATTLYQEVPRLAKREADIPRVEAPEDLHALVAFLARRRFRETTYINLGEVLACDTRTIRQKFVPLLEQLHIGERATRYDLVRDRTLRFYLRSPGYLTAFRDRAVLREESRWEGTDSQGKTGTDSSTRNTALRREYVDRVRVLLADHLRRLAASVDGESALQYWQDDDSLIDYIIEVDNAPVLFVSSFAAETGGTATAFDAFADAVEPHQLEVCIAEDGSDITVERIASDRLRLTVPHWVLLTVC